MMLAITSIVTLVTTFVLVVFVDAVVQRRTLLDVYGKNDKYKWTISREKPFKHTATAQLNSIYYRGSKRSAWFLTYKGAAKYLEKVKSNNDLYIQKEKEEQASLKAQYEALNAQSSVLSALTRAFPDLSSATCKNECPAKDCLRFKKHPSYDKIMQAVAEKCKCAGCKEIKACRNKERAETVKLTSAITHLNDIHEWSREQIADWLEATDHNLYAEGIRR